MWIAVGVAAAGLAVWWVQDLRRHQFGRCWWCGGSGRNRGSTRNRYGRCRHCRGHAGRRVRVGAKWLDKDLREQMKREAARRARRRKN